MKSTLYTRDILRLAASIPFVGPLDKANGNAELRSPTCGSVVRVAVRMDGEGRIAALSQSVEACAFGQAGAALMGQHAVGRSRGEIAAAVEALTGWLAGRRDDPGEWPGLAVLDPARARRGRHGAILLPFRALLAAVDDASTASPRT